MASKRTPTCIAIAFAATLVSTAHAGVDAWTTTGPRAAWDVIGGDGCAHSATIVGAFGRWARSIDAGSHWELLPPPPGETLGWDDGVPSTHFTPLAIAADRAGSGTLILATGTGRLEKSTDGGATWSELAARIPTDPVGYPFAYGYEANVRRVIVEGDRIFVAYGNAGLLGRSLDGGATLVSVGPPGIRVRDVDVRGARVVIGGENLNFPYGLARVFRSDDGGTTWRTDPAEFQIDGHIERVAISSGERVVALGFGHTPSAPSSSWVWTSDDGGLTFPVLATSWESSDATNHFLEPEAKSLRVADCRPTLMVLRDGATARVSEDAGSTWREIVLTPADDVLTASWAPSAYAGAPSSLVMATRNLGVTRSVDAGATFIPQNRGLPGAPQARLGAVVVDGERTAVANPAYRWNLGGGFYDRFGGRLLVRGPLDNRWTDVAPVWMATFVLPPSDPGAILAWSRYPFASPTGFRSADGGASWSPYGTPVPPLTERIGGGVEDTGRLFAFGTYFILTNRPGQYTEASPARSNDLGVAWANAAPEFVDTHALAAARSPTTRVYAGRTPDGGTTTGFDVSNDSGVTWTPTPNPATWAGPFDPIDAIAVDPANGNHVIVAGRYGNRVFESTDGGATWSPLGAALPAAQGLALSVQWQRTPRRVLVGTTDGLYSLEGLGASGTAAWTPIGATGGMRVAGIEVAGPAGRETFSVATDRGVFDLTRDAEAATVAVFRFYNTLTSTHFYTASAAEREHVIATWPQFVPEGTAFHAIDAARSDVGLPVWRFFNTSTGTHFYTASADERAYVIATYPQFVDEGVVYRALPGTEPGTVKLFRYFNTATGAHFYTTQDDERAVVNELLPSYADEGVVFAVYPAVPAP